MKKIKGSWYLAKLYMNATVANYTFLDYGFELIDGFVHV